MWISDNKLVTTPGRSSCCSRTFMLTLGEVEREFPTGLSVDICNPQNQCWLNSIWNQSWSRDTTSRASIDFLGFTEIFNLQSCWLKLKISAAQWHTLAWMDPLTPLSKQLWLTEWNGSFAVLTLSAERWALILVIRSEVLLNAFRRIFTGWLIISHKYFHISSRSQKSVACKVLVVCKNNISHAWRVQLIYILQWTRYPFILQPPMDASHSFKFERLPCGWQICRKSQCRHNNDSKNYLIQVFQPYSDSVRHGSDGTNIQQ